ncbi:MAG TPA: SRPBCC family protein [Pyrinomonadaceae bacterium]
MKDTDSSGGLYKSMSKHPLITGGLLLAGAGLAYASVKAMKSTSNNGSANEVHVETSITIAKSPEELFGFWRDFKNLPLFMRNLVSVSDLGDGKSHWVARTTGGLEVEWDAEIFNEIPNELIAWQSVDSADVNNAGSVRFEEAPEGRGTYVRVTMNYNPPAGKVGAKVAELLGTEPAQLIKEDLRRLKQVLEAGEIPTIDGQSSGRELAVTKPESQEQEPEQAHSHAV